MQIVVREDVAAAVRAADRVLGWGSIGALAEAIRRGIHPAECRACGGALQVEGRRDWCFRPAEESPEVVHGWDHFGAGLTVWPTGFECRSVGGHWVAYEDGSWSVDHDPSDRSWADSHDQSGEPINWAPQNLEADRIARLEAAIE